MSLAAVLLRLLPLFYPYFWPFGLFSQHLICRSLSPFPLLALECPIRESFNEKKNISINFQPLYVKSI